jgi:hypothetical protein
MRICTINRGSLKVFLRRDMHDVIIPEMGKAKVRSIGLSRGEMLHSQRHQNQIWIIRSCPDLEVTQPPPAD